MQIAHVSDLHLVDLRGATPRRLLNKRVTGYVNLRLRRRAAHQRWVAQAVLAEVRRHGPDHVVITGDLTNLALEHEFAAARSFLHAALRLPPERVSIVPGNHDVYTRGAYRTCRFQSFFRDHISSDLPPPDTPVGVAGFPYVRLRGQAAIIGLCTARPRPPFVASGVVGRAQLEALARLLRHPEIRTRTAIILQHHPWPNVTNPAKTLVEGLVDEDGERAVLELLPRGVVLHGHLHRRVHRTVPTRRGCLDVICTTSASLLHQDEGRMAGFHLYRLSGAGELDRPRAVVFVPTSGTFYETTTPKQ